MISVSKQQTTYVAVMMGKSHLMVGAAGYLAVGVPLLDVAGHSPSIAEIGAGTVVAAGASMLPDLDHPNATVAHSLGPVTENLAKVVAKVFGGHRNGTHSPLACLGVLLGSTALLTSPYGGYFAFAITLLTVSLVLRTLTEADGLTGAVVSAFIAGTLVMIAPEAGWLIDALTLGYILHLVGDMVTPEGIPPLWPISKEHRISFPLVGHTGDFREKGIALVCGFAAVYLLVTLVFIPGNQQDAAASARIASNNAVLHTKRATILLPAIRQPASACEKRVLRRIKQKHDLTPKASDYRSRLKISQKLVSLGAVRSADRRLVSQERTARKSKLGLWNRC